MPLRAVCRGPGRVAGAARAVFGLCAAPRGGTEPARAAQPALTFVTRRRVKARSALPVFFWSL